MIKFHVKNNIHFLICVLISVFLFTACSDSNSSSTGPYPSVTNTLETVNGVIEGITVNDDKSLAWLGVPYAKPPVGNLRWTTPQNPEPWEGTLETKTFKNKCIQEDSFSGQVLGSEDCLYLNIWRPATIETELPVLVFTHGGGNRTGSGESFIGDVLAEKSNSIIISINYRLGPLGWFRHPKLKSGDALEESGNFGLLDIAQSLKWIQKNIESFGGDASNITLSGQSAGARDVLAAMISPEFTGLFHKALVLSGGITLAEASDGDDAANNAVKQLVINDGLAADDTAAQAWIDAQDNEAFATYLRGKDASDLLPLYGDSPIRMAPFPHLFKDGFVIPAEGTGVFATGNYNRVPVILGSCKNEFSLFASLDNAFSGALFSGNLFSDETLTRQLTKSIEYGSQIYAGFNVDSVAALLEADTNHEAIYGYRFAWGSREGVLSNPNGALIMGATHGADVDFITGREDSGNGGLLAMLGLGTYYTGTNKPGRDALTEIMIAYTENFLHSGDPNGDSLTNWSTWNSNSGEDKILILDADNTSPQVSMSDEYLKKADIETAMSNDSEITVDDMNVIDGVLSGRFFMDQ